MGKYPSPRDLSPRRIWRAIRREDGVAAIEFGLIAAMVLPIFVASVDMGLAIRQRMQIDQVLNAGAQAAMIVGADANDILAAMTAAAAVHPALAALQVVVAPVACFCRDAPEVAVSCQTGCRDTVAGRFFELSAQMRYDSLFVGDLLPADILLLQSRLRIEVLGGGG